MNVKIDLYLSQNDGGDGDGDHDQRIYLDEMAVVGGALFFLTRLLRKQKTLRGAIPRAQCLARQVVARRNRPPA